MAIPWENILKLDALLGGRVEIKKYIYKITNTINNKSYIGQTVNWKRRKKEHFGNNKLSYISLIGRAIRKYGKQNFTFEVLGEYEDYNNQEKFFIEKYNTTSPNGYNIQSGGEEPPVFHEENHPMCKINKNIALNIINLLKEEKTNDYIKDRYDVSDNIIRHINEGTSWHQDGENYPLRKKEEVPKFVLEILDMLENTTLTQKEIAKKLNVARSTVTMINIGKNHRINNKSYPIRKI